MSPSSLLDGRSTHSSDVFITIIISMMGAAPVCDNSNGQYDRRGSREELSSKISIKNTSNNDGFLLLITGEMHVL